MDDYFFGVCYAYYKRQMQIWILLQHKYLRTSQVNIDERRFLYMEMGAAEEARADGNNGSPE